MRGPNQFVRKRKVEDVRYTFGRIERHKDRRRCLKCHHYFDSEGVGNRICPSCTNTNRSLRGSLEDEA